MEQTDYVSYELAKKLKETGFDWECRGYYPESGELCGSIEADNFNHLGSTYKGEWFSDTISAPTLWHAQKWLREKHKLHILVDSGLYGKWYYKVFPIGECCIDEGNSNYVTYEQALSAGIESALRLLGKGRRKMIARHYDCHYYCGYAGVCNLLGGECHKRCSHFLTEDRYYEILSESDTKVSSRYVPKIMFNTEFWVKYEADLAKEVALKVANKFNTPHEAAEYAVSVAKSVVEGLKRK